MKAELEAHRTETWAIGHHSQAWSPTEEALTWARTVLLCSGHAQEPRSPTVLLNHLVSSHCCVLSVWECISQCSASVKNTATQSKGKGGFSLTHASDGSNPKWGNRTDLGLWWGQNIMAEAYARESTQILGQEAGWLRNWSLIILIMGTFPRLK